MRWSAFETGGYLTLLPWNTVDAQESKAEAKYICMFWVSQISYQELQRQLFERKVQTTYCSTRFRDLPLPFRLQLTNSRHSCCTGKELIPKHSQPFKGAFYGERMLGPWGSYSQVFSFFSPWQSKRHQKEIWRLFSENDCASVWLNPKQILSPFWRWGELPAQAIV